MRIRRVFVEGLFGLFDHEILMKLEDQITIIHAPNGFGKTAILRMITGLLQGHYYELRIYPFNVFGIEFEDGRTLTVETCSPENGKEKRGKRRNRDNWSLAVSFDDNERYTFPSAHEQRGVRLHAPLEVVEQFVPELTRAWTRALADAGRRRSRPFRACAALPGTQPDLLHCNAEGTRLVDRSAKTCRCAALFVLNACSQGCSRRANGVRCRRARL